MRVRAYPGDCIEAPHWTALRGRPRISAPRFGPPAQTRLLARSSSRFRTRLDRSFSSLSPFFHLLFRFRAPARPSFFSLPHSSLSAHLGGRAPARPSSHPPLPRRRVNRKWVYCATRRALFHVCENTMQYVAMHRAASSTTPRRMFEGRVA